MLLKLYTILTGQLDLVNFQNYLRLQGVEDLKQSREFRGMEKKASSYHKIHGEHNTVLNCSHNMHFVNTTLACMTLKLSYIATKLYTLGICIIRIISCS